MRYWILVCLMSVACAEPSEVSEAPPAEASPPEARSPTFTEAGRVAVARFDDENLRECYDVFLAISQRPLDASLPEVGAQHLALLLLDYAIVSGAQGAGPVDDPEGQVTDLLETYVAGVAPSALSEEGRARYVESARDLQAMTWPTETLEYEVDAGTLVKTNECTDLERSLLAFCHVMVEEPLFLWSIRRSHFSASDTSDSDAGMKWCLRHGGEWTANDPESASERAKQQTQKFRELLGE